MNFKKLLNGIKTWRWWPNGTIFNKSEIDIQYFRYARRINKHDPLRDEYNPKIKLYVEEAAKYCGVKQLERFSYPCP